MDISMYRVVFGMLVIAVTCFMASLYRARTKFRRLEAQGVPIMTHSFLLGHLLVARQFYRDWASDANFVQTFGYYMSLHWERFFPTETQCPPVIYVDLWPIATPMAFSMKAYVSNQMEMGQSLPKSPMQGEFLRPITNGRDLNCMHGEEWRAWRSIFNPGFSQSNIRLWVPAILEEVETFAESIRGLAGQNGDWGQVFLLEKMSGNLAFDAVGRVILDARLGSQSLSPSPFSVAYQEQLEHMEITLSPGKLLWRQTPMFKLAVRRKRRQLFDMLRPFIMTSLATADANPGPRTVIQAAVGEKSRDITAGSKNGRSGASESFVEHVFYQLMIFFFGGEDAISITIPWLFKHLQSHPECVAKLRDEHDALLGSDPRASAARIREAPHILDSLLYTTAVIKESLRLNPATITIRQGQPDFAFHIDGSETAWPTEGFDLFDSSITIHRDPDNFPQPLEFIPERFLVPEGNEMHPPKNVWRGFQLGPRKCIGQEMALVVMKLVLVLVIREFEIELAWDDWDALRKAGGYATQRREVEGDRMYTTGKATSHPKDGAPVHARLRGS